MPLIRSSASERRLRLVLLILSLGKIMPLYSCCVKKRLFYVVILAPSGRQSFFYTKYIKSNIYSSCNIRLVFNTKYAFLIRSYVLQSL